MSEQLPAAPYQLRRVYATEIKYRIVEAETDDTGLEEDRGLEFTWTWRFQEPEKLAGAIEAQEPVESFDFDVALGLKVEGTPQEPQEIRAMIVGHFQAGWEPTPLLREFTRIHAVAMLMPYLRMVVSEVSARGPLQPYFLPAINVASLMDSFDSRAADAWEQVERFPALVTLIGEDATSESSDAEEPKRGRRARSKQH